HELCFRRIRCSARLYCRDVDDLGEAPKIDLLSDSFPRLVDVCEFFRDLVTDKGGHSWATTFFRMRLGLTRCNTCSPSNAIGSNSVAEFCGGRSFRLTCWRMFLPGSEFRLF